MKSVTMLLAIGTLMRVSYSADCADAVAPTPNGITIPPALIGAARAFERTIVAAVSLCGFESGAAFISVTGAPFGVPVILRVVKVVNVGERRYAAGSQA